MGHENTSAKQRIRVAYLEVMRVMWQRLTWKHYLGKDVGIATVEVKRNGQFRLFSGFLEESFGYAFPDLPLLSKSRPRLGGIKLTKMCLHQAEGLLNKLMELVDAGQRVDTHDAEDLFETGGKIEWGNGHVFYQSINPPKSRVIDAVQSHEHQEEVLLNSTEGLIEGEQIVALCQHLLLPTWAKEQMCSYHGHYQFVWIDLRSLLPACEH